MISNSTGKLFVIEGPDGVGKTTISKNIISILRRKKIPILRLSFPGNIKYTLGSFVYDLHHNLHKNLIKKVTPSALQALHIAAHIDYIESRIIPELKKGTNIILDRYWWSTLIYGQVAGINEDILFNMIKLEESVWGNVKPACIFYIAANHPFNEQNNPDWNSIKERYESFINSPNNKNRTFTITNTDLDNSVKTISEICESSVKLRKNNISVFTSISPAKTTLVFDTYWKFAYERQEIFFKRFYNDVFPWTDDVILQKYKFTNAYRASDRVSQYLIRNVIYHGDQTPEEIFFRIMLFKFFNKIETWDKLISEFEEISYKSYSYKNYDNIFSKLMRDKNAIYSAAYIMPSGTGIFKSNKKYQTHLKLLELMMHDNVPQKILGLKRFYDLYELLLSYPTIGEFLAYQFAIDINYSNMTNFSEMDFVIPGPGAKDGINKCFSDFGGLNQVELIKVVTDQQEKEFERLGLEFKSLWGRRLQLIDCQNLFCEVDKYSRIAHPEYTGVNGRKKIKQKFSYSSKTINYWYPPKWGINEYIMKDHK